jgi:hypothetical protein
VLLNIVIRRGHFAWCAIIIFLFSRAADSHTVLLIIFHFDPHGGHLKKSSHHFAGHDDWSRNKLRCGKRSLRNLTLPSLLKSNCASWCVAITTLMQYIMADDQPTSSQAKKPTKAARQWSIPSLLQNDIQHTLAAIADNKLSHGCPTNKLTQRNFLHNTFYGEPNDPNFVCLASIPSKFIILFTFLVAVGHV